MAVRTSICTDGHALRRARAAHVAGSRRRLESRASIPARSRGRQRRRPGARGAGLRRAVHPRCRRRRARRRRRVPDGDIENRGRHRHHQHLDARRRRDRGGRLRGSTARSECWSGSARVMPRTWTRGLQAATGRPLSKMRDYLDALDEAQAATAGAEPDPGRARSADARALARPRGRARTRTWYRASTRLAPGRSSGLTAYSRRNRGSC